MDPRESKSGEELVYQYVVAWGFARASQDLLNQIQQMTDMITSLEKKQRGETSPLREAVS